MITGTVIKNGTTKIVLHGTDALDEAALEQLNGAKCTFSSEGGRILDVNKSKILILELSTDVLPQPANDGV